MKSKVKKLLENFHQALVLAKVSVWMCEDWKETAGNFNPLPTRVSSELTGLQKVYTTH